MKSTLWGRAMNSKKSILCLVAVVLMLGWCAPSAFAFKYALGDLGKPADYDLTIKHFDKVKSAGKDKALQSLPVSFNWKTLGMVTPAKDQGSCGSCWAFASVGVFESKLLMAGAGLNDLSEQQQVSCNDAQLKCLGGDSTALRFWEWNGPMLESCTFYPCYNMIPIAHELIPPCANYAPCTTLDWRCERL